VIGTLRIAPARTAALRELGASTAAVTAGTAAVTAYAKAGKLAGEQFTEAERGITRASAATRAMAQGVPVATGAVSKFGQAMAGLKLIGYIGLATEAAAKTWEFHQALREVDEAMAEAGATDARPAWKRALDYLPEAGSGGVLGMASRGVLYPVVRKMVPSEGARTETGPATEAEVAALDKERRARGSLPPTEARRAVSMDAAKAAREKRATEAQEEQTATWKSVQTIYEQARSAARQARVTGDKAAGEVWQILTGGADLETVPANFEFAGLYDRLQQILPDDPEGAVAVVRERVARTARAQSDMRDELTTLQEDRERLLAHIRELDRKGQGSFQGGAYAQQLYRRLQATAEATKQAAVQTGALYSAAIAAERRELDRIGRLLAERGEAVQRLQDVQAAEGTRQRERATARRMVRFERGAETERRRAATHLERAHMTRGEWREESREERREERQRERDQRRARAAIERLESGRPITRRGEELLLAARHTAVARGMERGAKDIRRAEDAAAFREALAPLKATMDRIDKTLAGRLPEDQT